MGSQTTISVTVASHPRSGREQTYERQASRCRTPVEPGGRPRRHGVSGRHGGGRPVRRREGPDPADSQEDRRDAGGGRQPQVEDPLRHRVRGQHGDLRRDMNAAWDAWVDPANTPARATVEARLASPKYLVEIMTVAAI